MKKTSILVLLSIVLFSCKKGEEKKQEEAMQQETESPEPVAEEWITLFDGSSYDAWKGYLSDSIYPEWTIEDAAMAFTPSDNHGRNIISKEAFTNFELSLDWKVSEGGNSGIFWGVHEDAKFKEPYQTGPEIQVLDNERHPDAKVNGKLHQAGSLYDMIAPAQDVAHPAGEWNTCVIKIDHNTNQGSVTLNGTEIVKFPVHGEEWDAMVANSKFKGWEGFGKYQTGHIGLQDHGNKVWYRNIKIKPLK